MQFVQIPFESRRAASSDGKKIFATTCITSIDLQLQLKWQKHFFRFDNDKFFDKSKSKSRVWRLRKNNWFEILSNEAKKLAVNFCKHTLEVEDADFWSPNQAQAMRVEPRLVWAC